MTTTAAAPVDLMLKFEAAAQAAIGPDRLLGGPGRLGPVFIHFDDFDRARTQHRESGYDRLSLARRP
ncbi:MAG TPA: hypothetical protein VJX73_14400 [Terracidiphilus sp.]|nr:hypothetical protein [Terracidiphilus sp.]